MDLFYNDFGFIDIDGEGNVDYETWIKAMNRLNVNMDELIYKRVFWYLYSQNKEVNRKVLHCALGERHLSIHE